jgi:hypothetical protein
MGFSIQRLGLSLLLVSALIIGAPAMAQLAGADTAPGDSCAGFPTGATRVTADLDGDGTRIALICNGTIWQQEGIVVLSKTGAAPTLDGGGGATPAGNTGEIQFNDGGTDLGASSNLFWDAGNNRLGINDGAPAAALDVQGDINYTGVIVDVSDRRQKTDIIKLTNALEKMQSIEGVSFVMKNDPERNVELGVIAQDVEKVYPQLVVTSPDGIKSMNYSGMIGPLVEAVKELDDQNSQLRAKIHDLDNRLQVLEGTKRPPLRGYNN